MTSVPHNPIPENTPVPTLRRLLSKYLDPSVPVPTRYRLTMLARIIVLLAVAVRKPEGE